MTRPAHNSAGSSLVWTFMDSLSAPRAPETDASATHSASATPAVPSVRRLRESDAGALCALLGGYGLTLEIVADDADIPHSYWGEGEAGVRRLTLYARGDTPLHSVLHTAAHVICMDTARRANLARDCGGDDAEEEAVCYFQSLLAAALPGYGALQLWADMDAWGYHFRLGSARAWFEHDAGRARDWLIERGLLNADGQPRGILRA